MLFTIEDRSWIGKRVITGQSGLAIILLRAAQRHLFDLSAHMIRSTAADAGGTISKYRLRDNRMKDEFISTMKRIAADSIP